MIYIGLDDTDNLESRGTGHLARLLADHLCPDYDVYGITRHQLLVDPRIPYTAKNSCATLHIRDDSTSCRGVSFDLNALAERVAVFVQHEAAQGSDPAICVVDDVPVAISDFGRRVQRSVVTQAEARALANAHGMLLQGLGGTEDGVIGALAAAGLAATGNDGRFVHVGAVRELVGPQSIEVILAAGVAEVRDLNEHPILEGTVAVGGNDSSHRHAPIQGRLRPAMREGKPILYVEPGNPDWKPLKLD